MLVISFLTGQWLDISLFAGQLLVINLLAGQWLVISLLAGQWLVLRLVRRVSDIFVSLQMFLQLRHQTSSSSWAESEAALYVMSAVARNLLPSVSFMSLCKIKLHSNIRKLLNCE